MTKVLIIESDAAVARALSDSLEPLGMSSHITADGTEGLNLARTLKPSVIVLCVELSRVSGYSICNKLKKDPDLGQIPLILTSSQATEETFEQHKKLKTRAEAYLKKPYSDAEILGLIKQYAGAGGGEDMEVSIDEVSVEIDDDRGAAGAASDELDFGVVGGGAPVVEEEPPPAKVAARAPVRAMMDATVAEPSRASPRPTSSQTAVTDAGSEQMRNENRQLRQKVQKLEQALEQKDIEFNDRLLQESSRSREAVELKKKLAVIERDQSKVQQVADKAKADASSAQEELQRLQRESKTSEGDKQVLQEKVGQLVDKVKQLATERDQLQQDVARLQQQGEAAARDGDTAQKVREKAKKAVDIAMQLIDETGLLQ